VLEGVYQSTPEGKVLAVQSRVREDPCFDSAEEIYALPGAASLY